jgi:hypothetical protein
MQYYLLIILIIVIIYLYIFNNKENFVIVDKTTTDLQGKVKLLNDKLRKCNTSINMTKIAGYDMTGPATIYNNNVQKEIDKYKNYDFSKCAFITPTPTAYKTSSPTAYKTSSPTAYKTPSSKR